MNPWMEVYQAAGFIGVDPNPLTLRELSWMYEGKLKDEWRQTASVISWIVNMQRDPKKGRATTYKDFFPFEEQERSKEPRMRGSVDLLKVLAKHGRTKQSERRSR